MNVKDAKSQLRLLVLEGDGIGPEITAATLEVCVPPTPNSRLR